MANITTTVSDIQELDATNRALGQELIEAARAECDIYKHAFEKLTSELVTRDTKILALKERFQAPLMSSSAKPPQDASNGVGLMERTASTLADYDQINMNLLQQALQSCEQERDVYKQGLECLVPAIRQRDQEIKDLENQVRDFDSPVGSPTASPPDTPNKYLKDHIARVDVSIIDNANEIKPILHNLTYLIYQQENPSKDIVGINPKDPDLIKAAEKALKKIGISALLLPLLSPEEITTGLLSSYKRNVQKNNNIYQAAFARFSDLNVPLMVTCSRGKAEELFARYRARRAEYNNGRERPTAGAPSKYSDFPFKTMPLLAGDLSSLERIYTDLRGRLQSDNDQAKELEAKLKDIKEIRVIFFDLLNKCRA